MDAKNTPNLSRVISKKCVARRRVDSVIDPNYDLCSLIGMGRRHHEEALRCSFCHKSQDVVGKLISSPSDYPRAYICDECIEVCASIIEDDRHPAEEASPARHRFQDFPQAAEFFTAVEDWMTCEPDSSDAGACLEKMRAIAHQMLKFPTCDKVFTTRDPQ
jgi:hypothetical protein